MSERWVIVYRGLVGNVVRGNAAMNGDFLAFYDPEYADGRGQAVWTPDPKNALIFTDAGDAVKCWRQQPPSRPVRSDGEPNRPLTAFSIEIEALPEVSV